MNPPAGPSHTPPPSAAAPPAPRPAPGPAALDAEPRRRPLDTPVALYRLLRQFLVVIAIGLLVKLLMLTAVTVRDGHMAPCLLTGDRVLVRRGLAAPGLALGLAPARGSVVVLAVPHRDRVRACLRVAAVPGDSVVIASGRMLSPSLGGVCASAPDSVLPPEYSPRDFAAPLRLPRRGQTLALEGLSQRDFLFAASMQAQQDPGGTYDVKADLLVDGIPSNEYIISNFLLYAGAFGSIPDSLDYDWFFWDRLRDNLRYTLENRRVRLQWGLYRNGRPVATVKVRRAFVFALADDWTGGCDSRYFGPVCVSRIAGRVSRVLWSAGPEQGGRARIRPGRTWGAVRCDPDAQR